MKKVRVAVIGCGHLGKWHVQKARDLADSELVAIVEHNEESKLAAEKLYPEILVVTSLSSIIDSIDAAIVATPTSTHFSVVSDLLKSDKHVFCEKPLTSTIEEANSLKQLILDKNLVVQVGHSERFHNAWSEREKYPQFFKTPGTIRINRMAPFKGRAMDVDVVQDLMIHDLDLICHLFDDVPSRVHSIGHKIRTNKWDYVISKFSFKSGREAFITVARNHIKEVRELEITNKHGCFYIDLLNSEFHVADSESTEDHGFVQIDKYETRDHLLAEQEHFYKSILQDKPAVVDMDDGILAVKLVGKVLEGLENDCEVEIEGE